MVYLKNHDYDELYEFREFGSSTGKRKSSKVSVKDSSQKDAAEEVTKSAARSAGGGLAKMAKVLAIGVTSVAVVTGGVAVADSELATQVVETLEEKPVSQNSVAPRDMTHTVHTWDDGSIALEATCTGDGKLVYTCVVCKKTKEQPISAPGHKPVKESEDIKATCISNGHVSEIVCETCGAVLEEGYDTEMSGHRPGEPADIAEATCTENGHTGAIVCELCGEVLEESTVLEALGHDWGEFEVTKKATCTKKGKQTRTCTRCGETETEELAATGHVDKNRDYDCDICGQCIITLKVNGAKADGLWVFIDFEVSPSVLALSPDVIPNWASDDTPAVSVDSERKFRIGVKTGELKAISVTYTGEIRIWGDNGIDLCYLTSKQFSFKFGPEEYEGTKSISVKIK